MHIVCSMKLWRARPKLCHPSVKVFGWAILHDAQAGHPPTSYSLIDDASDRRPGNSSLDSSPINRSFVAGGNAALLSLAGLLRSHAFRGLL